MPQRLEVSCQRRIVQCESRDILHDPHRLAGAIGVGIEHARDGLHAMIGSTISSSVHSGTCIQHAGTRRLATDGCLSGEVGTETTFAASPTLRVFMHSWRSFRVYKSIKVGSSRSPLTVVGIL